MRLISAGAVLLLAVSSAFAAVSEHPYLAQEGAVPTKVSVAPVTDPEMGGKGVVRSLVPMSFDVLVHREVNLPERLHAKSGVAWTSALEEVAAQQRFSVLIDWDAHRVLLRPLEVTPRPGVPGSRSLEAIQRTNGFGAASAGPLVSTRVGPEDYTLLSRPLVDRARWVWAIAAGEDGKESFNRVMEAYGWRVKWHASVPALLAKSDMRFEEDSLRDLVGKVMPRLGLTPDLNYRDRVVEVRLADQP